MVSFVVISSSKEQRVTFASDFCFKKGIGRFDITIIEKDTTAKDAKQSIGIEDVKLMQKKIVLKPIRSPQKAVIIEDAHLLTTEAQNALLKVLEEPPANTILILGANTKESLLPTILSRCQLFVLEEDKKKLTDKQKSDVIEFIENLPTMKLGDRLKKAELLAKDKEKAIEWVEKLILVLREQTLNVILVSDKGAHPESIQTDFGPASQRGEQARMTTYITILQTFQKLHTTLKTTNVNPRFAIESTLIQLSI